MDIIKFLLGLVLLIITLLVGYLVILFNVLTWPIVLIILVFVFFMIIIYFTTKTAEKELEIKEIKTNVTPDEAVESIKEHLLYMYKKTINFNDREALHLDSRVYHYSGKNYEYFGMICDLNPSRNTDVGEKIRIIWSLDTNTIKKMDGLLFDSEESDPFFGFNPMKIVGNYMRTDDKKAPNTQIIFGDRDKDFSNPSQTDKEEPENKG